MKLRLLAFLASISIVGLSACGGGGDEDNGTPGDPNPPTSIGSGFVAIESPTEAPSYVTEESSIALSGSAFISPDKFVCCSGNASDTAVKVTWSNSAGGSDATRQFVSVCSFFGIGVFLCDHTWDARVPLAVGTNVIRVSATDFGRHSATDTIVVTRNPDRTPPSVVSVSPANGSINVAVNRALSVSFSEAMNSVSITPATFTVRDSAGTLIPGTVTLTGLTATFQPASFLAGFTSHTATLSASITDIGGNALPSHSWTFTTGNADLTPPSVVAVSPPGGSSCMPKDAEVTAVFSEPVDPSSVSNLGVGPSFSLVDITDGPSRSFTISGDVIKQADGTAAIFDPTTLGDSRTYTAALTINITDLAGNRLPSNMAWTFSTQSSGSGTGSWTASSAAPQGVDMQSAVWTGSEIIVFGRNGARYSPANDTWTLLPIGGPSPRQSHVAVWTGNEMIVWGGHESVEFSLKLNDGGRYNPQTHSWTPMSVVGAPSPRSHARAVWTGTEMVVWGGHGSTTQLPSDHAAYNPVTDTWRALSNVGAPNPRMGHTAVWTGNRMIVWGGDTVNCGHGFCAVATGGIYDPATDSWQPVSTSGAPPSRTRHSAVWTGTEMIVWGGNGSNSFSDNAAGLNTGGRYDPSTNTWHAISITCGPSGRYGHSAVWTGTEMIVWGGYGTGSNFRRLVRTTGARYTPSSDSWQHTNTANAPSSIPDTATAWTGSRMVVWGGGTAGLYGP